jgi:hypothetical protein
MTSAILNIDGFGSSGDSLVEDSGALSAHAVHEDDSGIPRCRLCVGAHVS